MKFEFKKIKINNNGYLITEQRQRDTDPLMI